jgi:hypothetical protein
MLSPRFFFCLGHCTSFPLAQPPKRIIQISIFQAVFGIWLIPLFLAIILEKGWPTLVAYITHLSPAEPVFVVAIMAIASSRPILRFAETLLAKAAALGGSTTAAWWLSILTIGPLLGSFITEPAAMTICAILLKQRFYALKPGKSLGYAALGLLFVNISVGGTLSHFAAPPVVMIAAKWNWDFHCSPSLQRAVMAGAVSGGGLTVIANAPNPAGQSILAPAFGQDGIAPGGLLVAALLPTIIMAGMFKLLP